MLIAIDESGSFGAELTGRNFFIAVHIRQRKTLYKLKERQFAEWEGLLPKTLKNPKGEIKSSSLSDEQREHFAREVICSPYYVGITPFTIRPSDNPATVVEKHRQVNLITIREGAKEYASLDRLSMAKFYDDFGNWLKKLSYAQYLKIRILGDCIADATVNTVGHAISAGYDEELPRMRFLIDRDFIKEPQPNAFWRELLRNQFYEASKRTPVPLSQKWKRKGHPFLDKYMRNGQLNFNELFWKHCAFVSSHEYFEIRIADAVSTIISRYLNERRCQNAYALVRRCFLRDKHITQIVLNDFDLSAWRYNPENNPWRKIPSEILQE